MRLSGDSYFALFVFGAGWSEEIQLSRCGMGKVFIICWQNQLAQYGKHFVTL